MSAEGIILLLRRRRLHGLQYHIYFVVEQRYSLRLSSECGFLNTAATMYEATRLTSLMLIEEHNPRCCTYGILYAHILLKGLKHLSLKGRARQTPHTKTGVHFTGERRRLTCKYKVPFVDTDEKGSFGSY